jgi:hypothetical protein
MFATVSTKKFKASLLKTAMAGSLHCWREPLEIKKIKRASEPASRERGEGGPEGHKLKKESEQASLRAVREQASIDVAPVIHGQRRNFADVSEQAEDRGASIKFYG